MSTTPAGCTLVTGGTGFIGAHLLRAVAARGGAVRTCGRGDRPPDLPEAVEYQRADLAGGDAALERLVDGVDVVVHAAGASSSVADDQEMARTNVVGTEQLLAAAHAADVARVVHVSTSSVYGTSVALPQPVPEDAVCHPGSGYASSKWQAEQVAWRAAEAGLPVAVLRPSTVYGPGAIKLVASTILDAAIERYAGLTSFAVPAEPVELRLVHIDDVVAACLHLAAHEDAPGRAFNLTSGSYPSSHQVARTITDELGLDVELTDDPDRGLDHEQRVAAHRRMLADGMSDRIMLKRERIRYLNKANPNNRLSLEALDSVGFRPTVTDVATGVGTSVRWYREQHWIV